MLLAGIVGKGQEIGEIRSGSTVALAHLYSVLVNEHVLLGRGAGPALLASPRSSSTGSSMGHFGIKREHLRAGWWRCADQLEGKQDDDDGTKGRLVAREFDRVVNPRRILDRLLVCELVLIQFVFEHDRSTRQDFFVRTDPLPRGNPHQRHRRTDRRPHGATAGLFKGAEDGTQAYFDYVNSTGGVNGRMIKLDAQDSAYSEGTVANVTQEQIKSDFALVGGFSLDDAAEEPFVKAAAIPDIAYPLDPGLSNLPTAYSPVPNNDNDFAVTIFKLLKKKFPTAIKHVGIIWSNATASTAEAEKAFERGLESQGFKIVYDAGYTASQSTFLRQCPDHEVSGCPAVPLTGTS